MNAVEIFVEVITILIIQSTNAVEAESRDIQHSESSKYPYTFPENADKAASAKFRRHGKIDYNDVEPRFERHNPPNGRVPTGSNSRSDDPYTALEKYIMHSNYDHHVEAISINSPQLDLTKTKDRKSVRHQRSAPSTTPPPESHTVINLVQYHEHAVLENFDNYLVVIVLDINLSSPVLLGSEGFKHLLRYRLMAALKFALNQSESNSTSNCTVNVWISNIVMVEEHKPLLKRSTDENIPARIRVSFMMFSDGDMLDSSAALYLLATVTDSELEGIVGYSVVEIYEYSSSQNDKAGKLIFEEQNLISANSCCTISIVAGVVLLITTLSFIIYFVCSYQNKRHGPRHKTDVAAALNIAKERDRARRENEHLRQSLRRCQKSLTDDNDFHPEDMDESAIIKATDPSRLRRGRQSRIGDGMRSDSAQLGSNPNFEEYGNNSQAVKHKLSGVRSISNVELEMEPIDEDFYAPYRRTNDDAMPIKMRNMSSNTRHIEGNGLVVLKRNIHGVNHGVQANLLSEARSTRRYKKEIARLKHRLNQADVDEGDAYSDSISDMDEALETPTSPKKRGQHQIPTLSFMEYEDAPSNVSLTDHPGSTKHSQPLERNRERQHNHPRISFNPDSYEQRNIFDGSMVDKSNSGFSRQPRRGKNKLIPNRGPSDIYNLDSVSFSPDEDRTRSQSHYEPRNKFQSNAKTRPRSVPPTRQIAPHETQQLEDFVEIYGPLLSSDESFSSSGSEFLT